MLRGADFECWRAECPEFDLGFREMASERLEEIRERDAVRSQMEQSWGEQAIGALRQGTVVPSPAEIRQAAEARSGAGLAVWLGMLIDGIPESIVIGSGFLGILRGRLASGTDVAFAEVVPYTLIAGLFLANFPEALSRLTGDADTGMEPNARALDVERVDGDHGGRRRCRVRDWGGGSPLRAHRHRGRRRRGHDHAGPSRTAADW